MSSSFNETGLLPGQSPPVTVITPTDQRGIVLIATAISLSFSLISLLIRLFIRLEFRQRFAHDDVVVAIAAVFSVLQSAAVFIAVSKGFGRTIVDVFPNDLVGLQQALYAGDLVYITIIWLTKCSVACLFLRLSPNKRHTVMSHTILLTATVSTFISIFIIALRCDLARPWISIGAVCTNLLVRWQVVAAFDVVTEVALFSTSIYIVHGLQLSLGKKAVVILAFGLRLPVVVPALLRIRFLGVQFASSDPTLDGVVASVLTQIEISYAIIAATTPCLRPFMIALSTHYGAPASAKGSPMGTGISRSDKDISLSSLSHVTRLNRADKGKQMVTAAPQTRWDRSEHHASVTSGDQLSVDSHESKQMIISKNTEWVVEYEGPKWAGRAVEANIR